MKPSVRFSVLKRDGFTCRYCGASAPDVQLHVDHVISRHDGGSDDESNLVAACGRCNIGKSSRSLKCIELAGDRASIAAKEAIIEVAVHEADVLLAALRAFRAQHHCGCATEADVDSILNLIDSGLGIAANEHFGAVGVS